MDTYISGLVVGALNVSITVIRETATHLWHVACSDAGNRCKSPKKERQTPFLCNSSKFRRRVSSMVINSTATSAGSRFQFSALNANTVNTGIPIKEQLRTTACKALAPSWCPHTDCRPLVIAQRWFPSRIIATWFGSAAYWSRSKNVDTLFQVDVELRLACLSSGTWASKGVSCKACRVVLDAGCAKMYSELSSHDCAVSEAARNTSNSTAWASEVAPITGLRGNW